jgi:hypothetical protein
MQGVELIFGENGGVRERLTDVLYFEVRKVSHNFGRRHTVRHEIDDMGDGNAEAADGCAPGQNVRVLGDAIEGVRHESLNRSL